jgi:alkylhydroperoxidase family enzyme
VSEHVSVNPRWPLRRSPRIKPVLRLPWFPPTTASHAVLLRHPRLLSAIFPLAVASQASCTLRRSERELVTLRAAWNAGGSYAWGHQANTGRLLGRDWAFFRRVARGPDALGWEPRQVGLLRAVDDLFSSQVVSEETWKRLDFLDERQQIELCLLTGLSETDAMLLSSLGVPFDGWSGMPLRLPSPPAWSAPLPTVRTGTRTPAPIPAGAPDPVTIGWLPRAPQARALLARHPRLPAALRFLAHRVGGHLAFTGPDCDLVVLRTLALCGLDQPWAQEEWTLRARATGTDLAVRAARGTPRDGREAALMQAADELHQDRCISDATWTELAGLLADRQLIELCYLVGVFRTLAMTCNTLSSRGSSARGDSG